MNSSPITTEPKLMPVPGKKYRLITRSDLDGLVCAIILKELNLVSEVIFAHPHDMQHGKIEVNADDISTNLPYDEGVYLCFDHHVSEFIRNSGHSRNHIIDAQSPSAARVVFEYFGGRANPALKRVTDDMMAAVDMVDSTSFPRSDILHPEGWVLLAFIMDARTGLGRFRDFTISNHQLMMKLIDYCRDLSIDQILALPDVRERVDLYLKHKIQCRAQIERCSTLRKNLIVLDLRHEGKIWSGNRFMIYALFPRCNISMHILRGKNKDRKSVV